MHYVTRNSVNKSSKFTRPPPDIFFFSLLSYIQLFLFYSPPYRYWSHNSMTNSIACVSINPGRDCRKQSYELPSSCGIFGTQPKSTSAWNFVISSCKRLLFNFKCIFLKVTRILASVLCRAWKAWCRSVWQTCGNSSTPLGHMKHLKPRIPMSSNGFSSPFCVFS